MYGKILNTSNQKNLFVPVVYHIIKPYRWCGEDGRDGFSHCVWSFLSDILYNVATLFQNNG